MLLNPAPVPERDNKRVVRPQLRFLGNGQPPPGGRTVADPGMQRPQHARRAVDEFGKSTNDSDLKFLRLPWIGDEVDKFQPFDAIIVTMSEEVSRDQEFDAPAQAPRREYRSEHQNTAEQHCELQDEPPLASDPMQHHRDGRYSQ